MSGGNTEKQRAEGLFGLLLGAVALFGSLQLLAFRISLIPYIATR